MLNRGRNATFKPMAYGLLETRLMLTRVKDTMSLALLKRGIGLTPKNPPPPIVPASRLPDDDPTLSWMRRYIAQPHAGIGRGGAVCPFVPAALSKDTLAFAFHDEVDGVSIVPARVALLYRSDQFQKMYPEDVHAHHLRSLILVFPKVPPERGHVVDRVHTELKEYLTGRGIMLSQFHPKSEKTAARNDSFRAYLSPVPCIALRHMSVHDIMFVDHNRGGFAEYHRRFAPLFEGGDIGDEHGYRNRFFSACERFGRVTTAH